MKRLLILACFLFIANAGILNTDIMSIVKRQLQTCAKKTQATEDDIATMLDSKIPVSHEGKCLLFCMHKIYDIQTENGDIDLDGALETLGILEEINRLMYKKMVIVFQACGAKVAVNSDPCITAADWEDCRIKESEALGVKQSDFTD